MMTVIQELDKKGLRQFGVMTGVIIVLLFAFFFPWVFDVAAMPIWPWVVAAVLWLPALLFPIVLAPVYKIWMKIGYALGWVNTRIILGLLFYVMIMPMGVVMRLFGVDPMARKRDNSASSYRVNSIKDTKDRLEKPY